MLIGVGAFQPANQVPVVEIEAEECAAHHGDAVLVDGGFVWGKTWL